jgi:hypothetical protein
MGIPEEEDIDEESEVMCGTHDILQDSANMLKEEKK